MCPMCRVPQRQFIPHGMDVPWEELSLLCIVCISRIAHSVNVYYILGISNDGGGNLGVRGMNLSEICVCVGNGWHRGTNHSSNRRISMHGRRSGRSWLGSQGRCLSSGANVGVFSYCGCRSCVWQKPRARQRTWNARSCKP